MQVEEKVSVQASVKYTGWGLGEISQKKREAVDIFGKNWAY